MTRTQQQIRDSVSMATPAAYVEALPLFMGAAGPLYYAEQFALALALEAVPSTSGKPFLDMIAHGQGLERTLDETSESLRLRIKTKPKRVTPAALRELLAGILDPLEIPFQLIEHWRIRLKVRTTGGPAYMNEAYASNNTLMGGFHGVTVILPTATPDAVRLSVAAALSKARAAGTRVWIIREDGLVPTVPPHPGGTYV